MNAEISSHYENRGEKAGGVDPEGREMLDVQITHTGASAGYLRVA